MVFFLHLIVISLRQIYFNHNVYLRSWFWFTYTWTYFVCQTNTDIFMSMSHLSTALLKSPEEHQAWEHFKENTLSIEIIKDDVLQKIYFQVRDKVCFDINYWKTLILVSNETEKHYVLIWKYSSKIKVPLKKWLLKKCERNHFQNCEILLSYPIFISKYCSA